MINRLAFSYIYGKCNTVKQTVATYCKYVGKLSLSYAYKLIKKLHLVLKGIKGNFKALVLTTLDKFKMGLNLSNGGRYHFPKTIRDYCIEGVNCHCEECGELFNPWQLELHHIDGNHSNTVISNIMVVCKNCHANFTNEQRNNGVMAYFMKARLA